MNIDYHELAEELDAREVLRYLNELGIRNISGEVLKYFITDLKKFIKYELDKRNKSQADSDDILGFERLHSASTFCSRSRSKTQGNDPLKCTKECKKGICSVRNIRSAPNLRQEKCDEEKPLRRACSCVKVEKRPDSSTVPTRTTASTGNLIKVPKKVATKKCDPVSLYHYYTSLWAKYKRNVPGENNWADLRWEMRQKMAGSSDGAPNRKVADKRKLKERNDEKIL